MKSAPLRDLRQELMQVYLQFLSANAPEPINVDSQIAENVRRRLQAPPSNSATASASSSSTAASSERYTFEDARVRCSFVVRRYSFLFTCLLAFVARESSYALRTVCDR